MTAYTSIIGLLAALCYGAYCGLVLEYGEKYRLVPEKDLRRSWAWRYSGES